MLALMHFDATFHCVSTRKSKKQNAFLRLPEMVRATLDYACSRDNPRLNVMSLYHRSVCKSQVILLRDSVEWKPHAVTAHLVEFYQDYLAPFMVAFDKSGAYHASQETGCVYAFAALVFHCGRSIEIISSSRTMKRDQPE